LDDGEECLRDGKNAETDGVELQVRVQG